MKAFPVILAFVCCSSVAWATGSKKFIPKNNYENEVVDESKMNDLIHFDSLMEELTRIESIEDTL